MIQYLNACLGCAELVDTVDYPAHHISFHAAFANVLILKGHSSYFSVALADRLKKRIVQIRAAEVKISWLLLPSQAAAHHGQFLLTIVVM